MSNDFDFMIKGGMVVTGAGIARADLGIRGEKVAEIGPDLDPQRGRRTIDATGKFVLPGVVDVHTHPVYLDDLGGISVTAAHGGVTTMIHYAYARPGMKLLETLEQFGRTPGPSRCWISPCTAGCSTWSTSWQTCRPRFKMGVTSFKVFMTYAKLKWMTDDYWMTALMDVVAQERGMVAVHAENGLATDYLEDKYLREGRSPRGDLHRDAAGPVGGRGAEPGHVTRAGHGLPALRAAQQRGGLPGAAAPGPAAAGGSTARRARST